MPTPRRCPRGRSYREGTFPPPPKNPFCEKWKLIGRDPQELVCLSTRPFALWVHYIDGRSQPCTACKDEKCWLGHEAARSDFHAWIAVMRPNLLGTYLLGLTPGAVACDPRFRDPAGDLRGLTMFAWRRGIYHHNPMAARIDDDTPRATFKEIEPNVRAIVLGMIEAPDRTDKQKNETIQKYLRHMKTTQAPRTAADIKSAAELAAFVGCHTPGGEKHV